MKLLTRVLPWALLAYIVVMIGLSAAGAGLPSHYLDEYVHVDKLRNFLEYGMYSWKVGVDHAGNPVNITGHIYVYGPIFSLVGHFFAVMMGAETWSTVATNDTAFVARHLASTAYSVIAVFATGWAVTMVTRSRVWGLFASALLVSIPLWTASATYNVKDIPASAGFTLFTAGCIALTRGAERESRAATITTWLALFLGAFILWGIRPGLWVLFVMALLALWLLTARLSNFRNLGRAFRILISPASAIAAGYAVMWAIYPLVFSNPVRLLLKSYSDTSDFASRRSTLTNGTLPAKPPSWTFLPQWILAQLPEVLLVALLVSAAVTVWLVIRRLFQSQPHKFDYAITALVFVFMQLAAFPLAAIVLRSKITSGFRQFLFILPATAMLVAIVLFVANSNVAWKRIRLYRVVAATLLVASTALTTFIQFQLFPYQANYFNPTTFSRGIEGRWELDRYGISTGELYSMLNASERAHCTNCSSIDYPKRYMGAPSTAPGTVPYDRTVVFTLGPTARRECTIVRVVTRPYLWSELHLRSAQACPVHGVPFTGTLPAKDSDRSKFWDAATQWGWKSVDANGAETRPARDAALAWTVTASTHTAPTTYSMTVTANAGSATNVTLHVTVNGGAESTFSIPVGAPQSISVTAPAATKSTDGQSLVVVEFTLVGADGKPVANTLTVSNLTESR